VCVCARARARVCVRVCGRPCMGCSAADRYRLRRNWYSCFSRAIFDSGVCTLAAELSCTGGVPVGVPRGLFLVHAVCDMRAFTYPQPLL
jgi:hypothetical protein